MQKIKIRRRWLGAWFALDWTKPVRKLDSGLVGGYKVEQIRKAGWKRYCLKRGRQDRSVVNR
jgi:hypothetical protein